MRLVSITPSTLKNKKYKAVFETLDGRRKTTHFGHSSYEDYTLHRDVARRIAYRRRHAHDNLDDPTSAGALSWWVLWGPTTSINDNIQAYRAHFGLG